MLCEGITQYESGWTATMTRYLTSFQYLSSNPGLCIFGAWGTANDWQEFRYYLGQCLMGNGIFVLNPGGSYGAGSATFMDEFVVNGVKHPLGAALQGPATTISSTYSAGVNAGNWLQGVWRRDFTNGIYLVNPDTNTSQTVALGGTYWTFPGTQDSTHNNNAQVTSVTIAAGDGYMLFYTQQ